MAGFTDVTEPVKPSGSFDASNIRTNPRPCRVPGPSRRPVPETLPQYRLHLGAGSWLGHEIRMICGY
jgi:hypothetical protein